MNTNITGLSWFSDFFLHPCALDESSLSIGTVQVQYEEAYLDLYL